jgi:signal transduction histidine kinase
VKNSFAAEVTARLGVLPNFFCSAPSAQALVEQLWEFAKAAYLDSPLPSVLKERLFVHLSRFCEVRYCIVRHVGFLIGEGRPAGDASVMPQTIAQVVALLRRPLPDAVQLATCLERLDSYRHPRQMPDSGTQLEGDLFDALTIIFLEPRHSEGARRAVAGAFGEHGFEILTAFLAFVRTAHFWTETHPTLAYEPDMIAVMAKQDELTRLLLDQTEAEQAKAGETLRRTLAALRESQGERAKVEAALRISEERLKLSLQEADRRKDEFLATLAHELRNPLAPLRNGLQIARLTSKSDSPFQRTIEMMDRQLTHLVHLVDDLLDVGRISSGKIELRRKEVTLGDVLTSSAEAARSAIDAHAHELIIEPGAEELRINADFDRLTQIFSNLLTNAAKYTERGGKIELRVAREGDWAVVSVADNGIGIPAADLPHVFELFSQVRLHQGRAEGGLGIGLSIVRKLVEMHQGTVSACSEGDGKGSTFTVRLPLTPGAAA